MKKELTDLISALDAKHNKTYVDSEIICSAGSRQDEVYCIKSGYVKVYDLSHNGDVKVMALLHAGDMFPLIWGFDHPPETVYYYKAIGETELEVMNRSEFKKQLSKNVVASHIALQQFVYHTWDFMERVKSLQMPYTHEKLLRLLPYLAAKLGKHIGKQKFELQRSITQEEIAHMLGVTRESISAHMSRIEKSGVITRKSGRLIIDLHDVPEEYIYSVWFETTQS